MTQPTFPPISMPIVPVVYQTAYEIAEENETETQEALLESLRKITETTFKDSGHATRSVHAKSHGLLQARLQVLDNLPAELAQGIFSQVETYPAVIRLSTTPGDI